MKTISFFYFFYISAVIVSGCGKSSNKNNSIELIADTTRQSTIFKNLLSLTNNAIPEINWDDSLAFLILPVQASCPSCRKKTIDSIVKHQVDLQDKRFIIISANGGRKTINGYFKEQEQELPIIANKLFLDSTNQALKYDLYDRKPTIYYTHNGKAFKKVAIIPATVRNDLHEYFSNKGG